MRREIAAFVVCCFLAAGCYFLSGQSPHALGWWIGGIVFDLVALGIAVHMIVRRARPPRSS